ncbi:T9SS type A sorting domain-containing protein [Runella sp. MFBS21]|uniref:T9SS type A sorting domain-containing protein n=1 Tax=Runella sp. MFBS21 TaxID=3034018 RepID=UPI0023F98465|nr:T9SS type A sorting domain-containing protein [Runella sp. MFBS21]MDF7817225.1 T9SS type A sorting domain-containing protein [Runella sp. MFBS21]
MIKHAIFFILFVIVKSLYAQDQISNISHRASAYSNPRAFHKLGDKLLFIANTEAHGAEWWVSDGSDAGTYLLKDITPGPESSLVRFLDTFFSMSVEASTVVANGKLYFLTKNRANQSEIWQTDGTAENTQKVYTHDGEIERFRPNAQGNKFFIIEFKGLYIADIVNNTKTFITPNFGALKFVLPDVVLSQETPSVLDYQLYFIYNENGDYELWSSNGSKAGTYKLFGLRMLHGLPLYNVYKGDVYVYTTNNEKIILKTKGTPATTKLLYSAVEGFPSTNTERFRAMTSRIIDNTLQFIEYPSHISSVVNRLIVRNTVDGENLNTVHNKLLESTTNHGFAAINDNLYWGTSSDIVTFNLSTGEVKKNYLNITKYNLRGYLKKLSNNNLTYFFNENSKSELFILNPSTQVVSKRSFYATEVSEINAHFILAGSPTATGNVNLFKASLEGQNIKPLGILNPVADKDIPHFVMGNYLYFLGDSDLKDIALYKTDGFSSEKISRLDTLGNTIPNGTKSGLLYIENNRAVFSFIDQNSKRYIGATNGTTVGTKTFFSLTNIPTDPKVFSFNNQNLVWFGTDKFYKFDLDNWVTRTATVLSANETRRVIELTDKLLIYNSQALILLDANLRTKLLEVQNLYVKDSTVVPLGIGPRYFYLRKKNSGRLGLVTGNAMDDTSQEIVEIASAQATFKVADGIFVHRRESGKSWVTFVDANGQNIQEFGPLDFETLRGVEKMGNLYALVIATSSNQLNVGMLDISTKSFRILKGNATDKNSQIVKYGLNNVIVGNNIWRITPAKDSLSRLLPDKVYQNARWFEQNRKLYVSFAAPSPETWEIDSLKTEKLGDFFVSSTRFYNLGGKRGFQGYVQNGTQITRGIYISESQGKVTMLKALTEARIMPEQPFAGMLLFTATSEENGTELWLTEGSPERTRQLADIRSGVLSSNPKDFNIIGDKIVLCSALTADNGRQFWNITPPILSIEPSTPSWDIITFPNPVIDRLSIKTNINDTFPPLLRIIDLNGRVVFEKQFSFANQLNNIDISYLPRGNYIVVVQIGNQLMSNKISKY